MDGSEKWVVAFLDIPRRRADRRAPQSNAYFGWVMANSYRDAVARALQKYPQLLDAKEIAYDPATREFAVSARRNTQQYFGVYHASKWHDYAQTKTARSLRAKAISDSYQRPETKPFTDLLQSLQQRVRRTEKGCWIWEGPRDDSGYGRTSYEGRAWSAHRLIYTLLVGPIPPRTVLRHACDNPGCVAPEHLTVGTQAENNNDAIQRGRAKFFGVPAKDVQ